ncbi:MAG: PAS domain S-box protein [Actinobacteria bacterium]|nr:MAG: PAS domain S-box protein [Actinomycetota bacterium]
MAREEEYKNKKEQLGFLYSKKGLLEQILSFSKDHIYVFDKDRRIVYVSISGILTLGLSFEELIGKKWNDLNLKKDVKEPFDQRLNAVFLTGKPLTGETVFYPDDLEKYYEYVLSPVKDEKGNVELVIAISRDITDRKRVEQILQENDLYNSSLLRLYRSLGQATTYTQIIEALRPEIKKMLGYESVYLQLVQEKENQLLLLDAGGPVEEAAKKMMKMDPRFQTIIGKEKFLIIPMADDPYLQEASHAKHVHVIADAQTHPLTNKEVVKVTKNRTIVAVPLILAEKKLGLFVMGTFGNEGVKVPNNRQIDYLETLANHVAVALDRVRFLAECKR